MPSSYPFHSVSGHSAPTAGAPVHTAQHGIENAVLWELNCPVAPTFKALPDFGLNPTTLEEWQRRVEREPTPQLLLIAVETAPGQSTEAVTAWLNEAISPAMRSKVALASYQPLKEWANTLKATGIARFIDLTQANARQWLSIWQQYWSYRSQNTCFCFASALQLHHPTETTIHNHTDIHHYREQLKTLIPFHPHLPNISTAAIEAIYNACYHGPAHGQYKKGQPYTVNAPQDVVTVTAAETPTLGEPLHLVSIADQWGRLTPAPIIKGIQRHIAGEGLLDESGRGHYLMTMLASQWAVAISPGQRTEYILFKAQAHSPDIDAPAPHLLVFES